MSGGASRARTRANVSIFRHDTRVLRDGSNLSGDELELPGGDGDDVFAIGQIGR